MSILTLDLGQQTGWTILKNGVIESGSESFHSGGLNGKLYSKFRRWLENKLQGISEVYFEKVVRHLGTYAAHHYGGFLAHLAACCEESNIPFQGVPIKTIKRFIAGNGNATKDQVIEAVRKKGFFPCDDNEADALALMFYVQSNYLNINKDINAIHLSGEQKKFTKD
ncbi:MAG: Holliday junction resolvase [Wolbachia endosymbiont of Tyrophagus putrescentiae]|nr:Holliday junction resolvase [Wolbachia endosymbiont of Tyrophagus putrescentiae]